MVVLTMCYNDRAVLPQPKQVCVTEHLWYQQIDIFNTKTSSGNNTIVKAADICHCDQRCHSTNR